MDAAAESYTVLNAVTALTTSEAISLGSDNKTFQAMGSTTSGAGSASIIIEVTNNTSWPWIVAGTLTLTLSTTPVSDGFVMQAGWKYVRARLSALSGTGATVSVSTGV